MNHRFPGLCGPPRRRHRIPHEARGNDGASRPAKLNAGTRTRGGSTRSRADPRRPVGGPWRGQRFSNVPACDSATLRSPSTGSPGRAGPRARRKVGADFGSLPIRLSGAMTLLWSVRPPTICGACSSVETDPRSHSRASARDGWPKSRKVGGPARRPAPGRTTVDERSKSFSDTPVAVLTPEWRYARRRNIRTVACEKYTLSSSLNRVGIEES